MLTRRSRRHQFNPEIARRHALAAEVRERETGLIISKRASRDPIDALVALSMAAQIATVLEPPKRSVYEAYYSGAVA